MKFDIKTLLIGGVALAAGGYALLHICASTPGSTSKCGILSEKIDELIYGSEAPHLNPEPGSVPAKSSVQLPNGMTRYLACDIENDPDCYQSRYASPAAPPQVLPSFYELTGDSILSRL